MLVHRRLARLDHRRRTAGRRGHHVGALLQPSLDDLRRKETEQQNEQRQHGRVHKEAHRERGRDGARRGAKIYERWRGKLECATREEGRARHLIRVGQRRRKDLGDAAGKQRLPVVELRPAAGGDGGLVLLVGRELRGKAAKRQRKVKEMQRKGSQRSRTGSERAVTGQGQAATKGQQLAGGSGSRRWSSTGGGNSTGQQLAGGSSSKAGGGGVPTRR